MSSTEEYEQRNLFMTSPFNIEEVLIKTNKPKVLGFMSLFYGAEYLRSSLIALYPYVDKMYICHTKSPSHGYKSFLPCPDSEEELRKIAKEVMEDKLIFESFDGFEVESIHRNMRYKYSEGMEYIITADADECLDNIPAALKFAYTQDERYYGTRHYLNFWKSFNHVNTDEFAPIRIEKLSANNQLQNHHSNLKVYHFSTAQNSNTIKFKNSIFGHASEIRPSWFEDIYTKWTPESGIEWLHPVSLQIWQQAQPFDRYSLPLYLRGHPNFNLNLIP